MATTLEVEALERRTKSKKSQPHKTPDALELHRTFEMYWQHRREHPTYSPSTFMHTGCYVASIGRPPLGYCTSIIHELADFMRIKTENACARNFRRHLHQYVRFKYAPRGKLQLSYKKTKDLVNSCYRVKAILKVDDEGKPVLDDEGREQKTYEWLETTVKEECELRKWLGKIPWENVIRGDLTHFIPKLHDMLKWMESFASDHPKLKGTRLYSLLPHSHSFAPDYVKLNPTTPFGVFKRIYNYPEVQAFLKDEFHIVLPARLKELKKMGAGNELLSFDAGTFFSRRVAIFTKLFHMDRLEKKPSKFAFEVKTNGYAASVLFERPSREVVLKKKKTNKPVKKRKTIDGLTTTAQQEVVEEEAEDPFTLR